MSERDAYFRAYHNATRRWAASSVDSRDITAAVQKDPELQELFTYAAREDIAFEARNLRRKASMNLPPI